MIRNERRRKIRQFSSDQSRTDRTTVWLLLLVITALVIALAFSDAHGATPASIIAMNW